MPVPFAINGLGRIGRALLRIAAERDDVVLVAANDLVPGAELARLVRRDTIHGPFRRSVEATPAGLEVGGRPISLFAQADPGAVPWEATGARVVVEATGRHLAREAAVRHLRGPVERVILSANAPDADVTLCLGVNDRAYDPARHRLVSNSSCTTNCLAPLLAVLDDAFGVERALATSVHPYTVNQRLLDLPHPDARRARAAALNVVPTATTAPRAVDRLLPRLAGRVDGLTVRVPTASAALLDLGAEVAAGTDPDRVRAAFRAAARAGPLAGILAVEEDELVSTDFIGSPASATVDLPLVQVTGRHLARVVAWYDNEWGYATRLADLVARLGHDPIPAQGGNP